MFLVHLHDFLRFDTPLAKHVWSLAEQRHRNHHHSAEDQAKLTQAVSAVMKVLTLSFRANYKTIYVMVVFVAVAQAILLASRAHSCYNRWEYNATKAKECQ